MDGNRFDDLARSLAGLRSRRSLLRKIGLATGASVASALGLAGQSSAATCRRGNEICRKHGECCSGVCRTGADGRSRCTATSSCTGEGTSCCPGSGPCAIGQNICCNGYCAANNELNCGTCGNSCGVGETCCKAGGGQPIGGNAKVCANLQTSNSYCGSCGTACVAPTYDSNGVLISAGETCCNGQCVPNNESNCNCQGPCPGPYPNATVTCLPPSTTLPGGCYFECQSGYQDCNENVADGCETPVPPLSDSSCGLNYCNRAPCPDGTTCVSCSTDGTAGICCAPGQVCGGGSGGHCGCAAPGGTVCTLQPTRGGRFIR